jgi:hypothetical protein
MGGFVIVCFLLDHLVSIALNMSRPNRLVNSEIGLFAAFTIACRASAGQLVKHAHTKTRAVNQGIVRAAMGEPMWRYFDR